MQQYIVGSGRIRHTALTSSAHYQGNLHYDGKVLREKGDVYMVDCNVTGSDPGTASDPKFPLKDLFQYTLFPEVARLVGPGGKYEGYLPVFQGDNAGPHEDTAYKRFAVETCNERGWKWEPQAPQMPHTNVLDLAVFPAMSKRHSALLSEHSNTCAPANRIWEECERVWHDLPSAQIARGFILANRVAKKVIEHEGDNTSLQNSEFHSSVRNDFHNTNHGVVRKKSRRRL